MSSLPFKLNVDGDSIRQIIQRVQASLSKASDRLANDYGFNNGHGMAKWSFIYSHQLGNDAEELASFKTKRNGWKVTGLVDTTSKTLFFLLSQDNLDARQTGKIKPKVMHYISAISGVCNADFQEKLDLSQRREMQISFGLDFDEEEARQIYKEMLQACPCEIEQFCVISLDMKGYELKSVKANILNENLDTLYEEDWSDFITVASNDDSDKDDKQQEQEQEQHDMTVSIKRKHKKTSE
ncbi:DUF5986 family protein [Bacillus toyonensis]|uniref:DUF5986 family protein n=1 Tax=Bacillus toyonensis TaxID=155322 RepID=UPI00211D4F94|nr:DUF5986 family protein [Bacillus toyonensis]